MNDKLISGAEIENYQTTEKYARKFVDDIELSGKSALSQAKSALILSNSTHLTPKNIEELEFGIDKLRSSFNSLDHVLKKLLNSRENILNYLVYGDIWDLMVGAWLIGSHSADENILKEHIDKIIRRLDLLKKTKGGNARGANQASEADLRWRNPFKLFAINLRNKTIGATKASIIKKYEKFLNGKPLPVSFSKMSKFLKDLEQDGHLKYKAKLLTSAKLRSDLS